MNTTSTQLKILLKHLAVRCRFYESDNDSGKPRHICGVGEIYKATKCQGVILNCEYDEEKDGEIE